MADAKQNAGGLRARPAARPLSPHLTVFRPYINMTMSILHRMTGTANYFGSVLVAAWLIAAATSDDWFNTVSWALGTLPGLIVLFGFTWSVMHHLLGGVRHFIWDTIHGLNPPPMPRAVLADAAVLARADSGNLGGGLSAMGASLLGKYL